MIRAQIMAILSGMREDLTGIRADLGVLGERVPREDILALRERIAHMDGLLEGLRDAIVAATRDENPSDGS